MNSQPEEQPDESIYDRIRREARERDDAEQARQRRVREFYDTHDPARPVEDGLITFQFDEGRI